MAARYMVSRLVVTLMMRPQPCLSSDRQRRPRHQKHGDHIDVDDAAEFRRRHLPEFADRLAFGAQQAGIDAGIVDEDVEAAEMLDGGAHDFRRAVVARDVGDDALDALAGAALIGAAFGFLERRRVDLDGGDARAGFEQSERHHLAEAAPGAGDDRDFSVKHSGHDCLSLIRS